MNTWIRPIFFSNTETMDKNITDNTVNKYSLLSFIKGREISRHMIGKYLICRFTVKSFFNFDKFVLKDVKLNETLRDKTQNTSTEFL